MKAAIVTLGYDMNGNFTLKLRWDGDAADAAQAVTLTKKQKHIIGWAHAMFLVYGDGRIEQVYSRRGTKVDAVPEQLYRLAAALAKAA